MPRTRICSFCGKEIEPGTGVMYVRKDGTVFTFCSSKCERNMIKLKRKSRKVEWTEAYRKEKAVRVK
ncbi:MAG: 50S ribosomal protein L24e [Methanomicrobia archaeon]|nr:50S ribosomal protein L24e [Methanomicrobia archaeon]HDM23295.1 50S ribosomal protein L24e [Methanomicrobia archaeon]